MARHIAFDKQDPTRKQDASPKEFKIKFLLKYPEIKQFLLGNYKMKFLVFMLIFVTSKGLAKEHDGKIFNLKVRFPISER